MVSSGSVSNRSRASSPTIIFPLAPTLTTDGKSDEPYGPGIVFGAPVCASRYATRLYVVPRSIPTTLPMIPLRSLATLPKIPATTRPPRFLSALHPLNSGCSSAGSELRPSAPAKLTASLRPPQYRAPHPTAFRATPVPHPLPSTSPESSVRPRPNVHAKPPGPRPRPGHLAI